VRRIAVCAPTDKLALPLLKIVRLAPPPLNCAVEDARHLRPNFKKIVEVDVKSLNFTPALLPAPLVVIPPPPTDARELRQQAGEATPRRSCVWDHKIVAVAACVGGDALRGGGVIFDGGEGATCLYFRARFFKVRARS
jgi:hypothetical protein